MEWQLSWHAPSRYATLSEYNANASARDTAINVAPHPQHAPFIFITLFPVVNHTSYFTVYVILIHFITFVNELFLLMRLLQTEKLPSRAFPCPSPGDFYFSHISLCFHSAYFTTSSMVSGNVVSSVCATAYGYVMT